MATLTLKKSAAPAAKRRSPLRGSGAKPRPTLAQAQAERAERAAQRAAEAPSRPKPEGRSPGNPGPKATAPARAEAPRTAPPRPARAPLPPARPVAPNTAFTPRRTHPAPPPPATGPEHEPGTLRLSKRMSELGARVHPGQQVTIDKKARTQQAQRVTVLLHKPVGYVSGQAEDGYEPASVLVTAANHWREDASGFHFQREHLRYLAPAGRLDIDSTGLLVLTQDGRIAKQLIGEDSEVEKEYLVRVQSTTGERLSAEGLRLLNHGLELDGEPLRPARVEWVNDDQLRFVLVEGKKRQIRRMCEAVGLKVTGLKRVRIGRVMLGDLPAGQWRYLGEGESFA